MGAISLKNVSKSFGTTTVIPALDLAEYLADIAQDDAAHHRTPVSGAAIISRHRR